ncbi:MAG: sulfite oxidase-like oxidoreductase [Chloroflexi bacterium]|nr:sulfite oxidase-like oxidoreductase [Chloroflexota bacterium]
MIVSPDTLRKDRVPPGQRLTDRWPVLHYGPVPAIDPANWTLTIKGLVDKGRKISYEEFMALPQVKVLSDIHCVTTWSALDYLWEGVSTSVVKDLVQIRPEAKYVMAYAPGGFSANLPLDDFFQPDVLFAVKCNGHPLAPEHGYPVRLIVPRLYLWKSAKWIDGIEFMEKDRPGFWESHGYHNHGDPWKEERYS